MGIASVHGLHHFIAVFIENHRDDIGPAVMLIQLPMRRDEEFGNIQSQDLRESVENLGILLQKRVLQT